MSEKQKASPVLYLMLCAAPPAQWMHTFIPDLQAAGWDVCVIVTPQATRWIDTQNLEAITGHLMRTDYKLPGEADPLPKAQAILVMPATFNTINKWAQGIGDTLVCSLLCECLGRGTPPIVVVPCLIQFSREVLLSCVSVASTFFMSRNAIHRH